jgi:hypothetical protein
VIEALRGAFLSGEVPMFAALRRRSIACAALGFMAAQAPAALAITGGVSVDEVLAAGAASRYTRQQIMLARAVSAVTVPLIMSDANGRSVGMCSATIVHPRVVLTAAHCVLDGREVSRRIRVRFDRGTSERQALDVVVHPKALKLVRNHTHDPRAPRRERTSGSVDAGFVSNDLALVLLHRPIPESHDVVAPVAPGFRDSAMTTKIIAGYGKSAGYRSAEKVSLHFAELNGNSSSDEGIFSGEDEIFMESRYRDGERVNVCAGDSGGPIFVLDHSTLRLRQLAVTSAGDDHCRDVGMFASIARQRAVLHAMFDTLMEGEPGADENPF